MRIFRHLFEHKAAFFAVIVLLVAQAACDLSLPRYTSDIIDIGIQQSGIEHVTCEEMTDATHTRLLEALSGPERQVFADSYDRQDGFWVLNDRGRSRIDELDAMLARPLIAIHGGEGVGGAGEGADGGPADSGADLLASLDDQAQDSLLHQRAISATMAEYEDTGYDLTGMQMGYLARTGLAMALIAAAGMAVAILVGFVASRTGARIGRDLRDRLFSRVVSFSEREIGRFSAASLITRGTNDIQLVQNVSIMLLRMVLFAPILALGGIVMVMATNVELGWIVVVAIVAVFVIVAVLFGLTLPRFKVMQKLIDRVNLVAREILSGMPVVRAFDRQAFEEARFDAASTRLMKTQLFTNRAMTFMMPAMMLVMNLTSIAIVWFGGLAVEAGTLQTGDLIAFITYAMVIIMGFLMLGMIAIMLPRANVAAERVDEVIACTPSIVDPAPAQACCADRIDRADRGASIRFDDVSFCYDDGGECEDVLSHVSFCAEPGQTVALIGATGSGKSTVLKLIERFYDATAGTVSVDGMDVRRWPQALLRAQFGYVPQKAFLFSGDIRSNVAYSDEGMSDERVREAVSIAQATALVDGKEHGLESEIAQGGTNVSGGQRQRLAIARAIATDARAFLFDDSFSALDYKTDAALRAALRERLGDVTCVIVAQRIATVMNADKIVVLDEGRVVGEGTHGQLLESCAEYREIALSQLSAEELGVGGEAA